MVREHPFAEFTWSPEQPMVGETVTFNGSLSTPDGGYLVNYTWNFGDGTPIITEGDPITTHVYTTHGKYNVTLTVTDSEEKSASVWKIVKVYGEPYSPVADFVWSPAIPLVNETVTFNASASQPGFDGMNICPIAWYYWDFGNGIHSNTTDPIIEHSYELPGTYNVTLTVYAPPGPDDPEYNPYDSTSDSILVVAQLSVSISPTSSAIYLGQSVNFDSAVSGGVPPYTYQWYVNETAVPGANSSSWIFTPTATGFYVVFLEVTDNTSSTAVSNEAYVTVSLLMYYLTVGTDPVGIVTIPGEGWYENSTYVDLTAPAFIPNESGEAGQRYRFSHWTVDGNNVSGNPISVHMDANHTATAHYVRQYYLTVVSPYGVTSGQGWYDSDSTAYAVLNTGIIDHLNGTRRVFTNWGGDATGTGLTSDPITMNAPKTAVANWKTQYYLTVSSAHGTTGGQGWYDSGATAYASVSTNIVDHGNGTRRVFVQWSGDATGTGTISDPITMNAPKTAVANWKTQYLVSFDQTGLDSNATGTVVTVNGSAKTFGDLPFTWWVDNCSWIEYSYSELVLSLDPNENFTLINVTGPASPFHVESPVTVVGNYQSVYKVQYYLTVTSPYGTPGGMGWYDEGATAYATLNTGVIDYGNGTRRVFTHWSGDASGTNYAQSNPITMNSNKTAIANWKTQYYLTVISPYATTSGEDWYDSGSTAYASVSTNVVDHGNGTRRMFVGWTGDASGAGTTSDPITMNAPRTAIASWKTQYYLTVTSPYGTPGGMGWYDSGSTAYATLNIGILDHGNGTRRMFTQWNGDASGTNYVQSDPITMNRPKTAIANWKTQYYLTVTSPYDSPTPTSGWFDAGTPITASVTSPWPGTTGIRYVCTGWTGTGSVPSSGTGTSVSFTINMPSSITWAWKTQYLLTVRTDPAGLSPQPTRNPGGEAGPAGSWWYDESTDVILTAQSVPGYTFLKWDVQGTDVPGNPIGVHMNMPLTATAHYEKVCAPVGGVIISMSKAEPTATPWTELISTIISILAAIMAVTVFVSRRRGKKTP